ncbi:MAG: HD-GYP domain-containing protein [Candidatus Krumholzibacteriia bacterium]|nr:HD-GYP domain-containing protein [bacterium]MCB9513187.1 HD-GYP domain-containing protein [Candidatus Latescibacterota bacterium]MCB9514651.1 HD-GYP domain-containing protein [Candidatus Latescibacterota bacterium]
MATFLSGRSRAFIAYYFGVSLLGYVALYFWSQDLDPRRWLEYAIFILLVVIADLVNVTLPHGGASISVSTPITFASIVIFGPFPAAWMEAVSAIVVEGLVNRRPLEKIFFNVPVLALSTGVAGMAFQALPYSDRLTSPLFLVPLVVCGIVHWLVNTTLVSTIIGLSDGRNPLRIWRSNYFWNLRHLVAFVPLTAIIILVYRFTAPWTLALFIIPLLLLRYAYRLYLDMKETHIATLTALTSALDAKDAYTHGHSYRVSRYALMLARALGIPSKRMELLEYAALLHDIGKIGVSGDIISKDGKLTDEEYRAMKAHPAIGAKIIERLKFLNESAQIVKYHHERPDGRGYPDGLKGEEIPFEARILQVCDTLDAMTSTRSYRKARSVEEALEEFKRHRGTQFDPEVVDALVGLHGRGELVLIGDELPVEIYDALQDY